ncbi:phosphonate C-P lyase system protein PhnG [Ornithinibacillus salinisoli]|uniref:Phosphonate C-P lyase system protein PhnG n=1 Tax=Ornithinibacillus salinisoli TaxID=1848459 RepID=A0ABW4VZ40_9BACI
MNRRRRTEILIQGNSDVAREFAESIIERYPYREIMSPRYGLTMIKMRETAKNSLFHLGEVLVTEAKVEIHQQIGIGIVIGMKDELAKHLAIIDSAYKANVEETNEWEERLLEEEQLIFKTKVKKQTELLKTRVQFETMDI